MSDTLYGVLPSGFSRMRLPEIRQEIIDTLQATTGLTFETRPDSITGQFINVFAEREATLWELAEAVYFAMYPISATGINLDHSVSFAGVRRLFAQRSIVWCGCYGVETTIIPAGSMVRSALTQDNFLLEYEITITRQAAIDVTVEVLSAVVGQEYWIRVDQAIYRHVAIAGDTIVSIATALWASLLPSDLTIGLDANFIRIYKTKSIPFALQLSTNIGLSVIGSSGIFVAEDYGSSSVEADTITQIVSTMTGWDKVNNYVAGRLGRNLETDDELRLRYDKGVFRLGAATLKSIRANLEQNIPGQTAVQVYNNDEDVSDSEGRPPHSIEVIIAGGEPQAIAAQIYLVKAAGIDTFGEVLVQVPGSSGYLHPIYFNRPTPAFIWVDVTVTLYNEEIFPDGGVPLIQLIITNTGNNFGIGKDVIPQRFHGPIYSGVSGIGHLDIKVAKAIDVNSTPAPGDYVTTNIPISARELATFDVTKILVTILDARNRRR